MSTARKECSALSCRERVGPHMLLCRAHWAQLTPRLRQSLSESCHGALVQSPSYRLDVSRAILYLSRLESWERAQGGPHDGRTEIRHVS